ncbi:hypothetical protein KKA33_02510 [Patescibacteria group bacterium]|nr:hypothetical protein [Patescibacteria group bacterium]
MDEFYTQLAHDCQLCQAAQAAERQKAQTGDCLAEQRATELNTYLTIFQNIRDELASGDLSIYSQEELADMRLSVDDTRERFVRLLADPQYAGQTGKIFAEWAEKECKEQ